MSKLDDYRKAQEVERILGDPALETTVETDATERGRDVILIEIDWRVAQVLAGEIRSALPALLANARMEAAVAVGAARLEAEEEARALLAETQHAEEEEKAPGPVTVCP